MTASPRIAVIGGGSAVWTRNLLADLAADTRFDTASVSLMDIDEAKVDLLESWCRRYLGEQDSAIEVESTTDRARAISGADVVIVQISVGGNAARRIELDVPERHGVFQTVGDSVGPGGIIRAIRQGPALIEIADTVASEAPDALLVELTNPMAQLCRMLDIHGKTKHVGYCHGAYETLEILSSTLKTDHHAMDIRAWGVNHFLFMREVTLDGHDAWPLIHQHYEQLKALHPSIFDFWETFGEFPINNDRHPAEFVPYYLRAETDGGKKWGVSRILEDFLLDNYDQIVDQLKAQLESNDPIFHPPRNERLVEMIGAWLYGPGLTIHLNLPNSMPSGQPVISGLPEHAVIEAPALVDRATIVPIALERPLADPTRSLVARVTDVEELTAQAAYLRDAQLALGAMALDPLVPSTDSARLILRGLLEAQREWIPDWESMAPMRAGSSPD
ncbi:MAG: hypothetical protein DCC49_08135 [Acidobacteria bacterium]|nr:MAG: hypothetical protein DCC49_08135 [Acidobacteriota bacterium]